MLVKEWSSIILLAIKT